MRLREISFVLCLALLVSVVFPNSIYGSSPLAGQTIQQQDNPFGDMPFANADANLRTGPGTSFARMGSVEAGQFIAVVGRNAQGDWLQLRTGAWIAASLVDSVVPTDLPIVSDNYADASPEELVYISEMTRLYNNAIAEFALYMQNPEEIGSARVVEAINSFYEWQTDTRAPDSIMDQAGRIEALTQICHTILNGPFTDNAVGVCLIMFSLPNAIPYKFRATGESAAIETKEDTASVTPAAVPSSQPKPTPAVTPTSVPQKIEYKGMLGNIWSGVKVYYGNGSEKSYAFEILGGGECSFGNGAFVEYPDGTREWKSRMAMIDGPFYCRADDPALKAWAWYEYTCYQ